jgi:ATP-dependent Clp protease ATP-binding subunit ClpA
LQKKLRELGEKLAVKNVSMELSDDVFEYLLKEGFNPIYGAREMDRVIGQQLKPVLMREILFGSLKQGGIVKIILKDGCILVG